MNIYGMYVEEAYHDEVITESVEGSIKKSGGNIDRFLSKFNLTKNDVQLAKNFVNANQKLLSMLKKCKTVKDIRALMKTKEYKDALDKEAR